MAEEVQHTSSQLQLDYSIWHRLIFYEELENDDENGAGNHRCATCWEPVLLRSPAYKCLKCDFHQHKSCADRSHGLAIEINDICRSPEKHHVIFIEDLDGGREDPDSGGEEKKVVCWGCKEPAIGPAYKCSVPNCAFILHKSCGELPTLIKHPLHGPDHILRLQEPSVWDINDCYVCRKDCSGSMFYNCEHDDLYFNLFKSKYEGYCRFSLHGKCALLSTVNADDCHQHKLIHSRNQVQFTCESCGEETKDFACLCTECRVLIHGKCARFHHTIKTTTHDHTLTRTYSLSHQLDVFCKLCYKKLNTEHAAYYCCRECGYVAHLDCAKEVRDSRPPNEWVAVNSVDYLTHLVHLVEGNNPADDERANTLEIQHFSHQHNLILSNEEPIDDMRCEACMQFIIFRAPFYGCTQCNFFLHDRCAKLPITIQRGIFHEHPLTLLSPAQSTNGLFSDNGLFECTVCKRFHHGFTYSCSSCQWNVGVFSKPYNLDVQCCLIPETLKHEGHQHSLFLAISFSEICNACSEDCAYGVCLVCTDCNFILCIRCATLPLVAKYEYHAHILKLSYTREDASEEYYCMICEEERDHPDNWFYYCVKCKFTAHPLCVIGEDPYIKFGTTFLHKDHFHLLTFIRKTQHSPPCDYCMKPFGGLAVKCAQEYFCKFNVHPPFNKNGKYCLRKMKYRCW